MNETEQMAAAIREFAQWLPKVATAIEDGASANRTAINNAAAWFAEKELVAGHLEQERSARAAAEVSNATLARENAELRATVADLEQKVNEYPDHPDVKAARVKQLEALVASAAAELENLRPAT